MTVQSFRALHLAHFKALMARLSLDGSTPVDEPALSKLDALRAQLGIELAGLKQANRAGLGHAIRSGGIIEQIKVIAGHGGFLETLAMFKIGDRSARRWKRLYEWRDRLPPGIESERGADDWVAAKVADDKSATRGQSEKRHAKGEQGSLERKFGIPPIDVFDARGGALLARKKDWKLSGIVDSVETREATDIFRLGDRMDDPADFYGARSAASGGAISAFNPALAEMLIRWLTPLGGLVLDPFAGGSVRGLVALECDREYHGIDIRLEQIEANERDADKHISPGEPRPKWACGDAAEMLKHAPKADFVFSCPPYGDIESYSDLPGDLSNMEWDEFKRMYACIIKRAVARLKGDRFAAFVVGNLRYGKHGYMRDLVGLTVQCFERAGAHLYNEGPLLTPLGTTPIKCAKWFMPMRKLGRAHQSVLIFCKGDPRKATAACEALGIEDFDPAREQEGMPVQMVFDFGAEDRADE
jgi:hypothetical protein